MRRHGSRLARNGRSPLIIVGALLAFSLVPAAHADAFIYWANESGDSVGRAELNGTDADQSFVADVDVACGQVAVDDAHIYWANYGSDAIGRANLDGSDVDQSFIGGVSDPCQVAVDAAHVYWGNLGTSTIGRADLDGGAAAQSFVTGTTSLGGLALTPTHIYWTNRGAVNTIGRAALSTPESPDQSFITGASTPTGMTVDATHVYWANSGTDTLARAAIASPASPDLSFVTGADNPCGVALSSTHIFWTNTGPDTIGRAPRANPNGPNKDQSFVTGAINPCGVAVDALGTPSNHFRLGKVTKNKRRGTAKLKVIVPGAGELELARTRSVRGANKRAEAAGSVTLPVRPRGKARRKLDETGRARVAVKVTFSPDGGDPATKRTSITLVKR
jgi:virginiamycin B lyase